MTQTEAFGVTVAEMIAELRRELAMRRSVFPRLVGAGKIAQSQADRRILIFEELLELLDESHDREAEDRGA